MPTGYKVSVAGHLSADLDDIFIRRELISQSTLYSFGRNNNGQLGDNSATDRSSPVSVFGSPYNTWRVIGHGSDHSAGVKTDGTIWTWGRNDYGQLGDNSTTSRSSPVTVSGGGSLWKSVACGLFHTVATRSDGTLWCWGRNDQGQLGDNSTTNRSSPVTTSGGGSNWEIPAAGFNFSLGIKTDNTLWAWGLNTSGQLGVNDTTNKSSPVTTSGGGTNWTFASGGELHATGVKSDGTLWTWGNNASGQLGTNDTVSRSSPGTTSGGTLNWRYTSAGAAFTLATKFDGTLWAWGSNTVGQLGDNSTTNRSSPVTTSGGGTTWKYISAANSTSTSAAIKTDGTFWTWGANAFGQLGTNNTTNRSSPGTVIGSLSNWKRVSTGLFHTSGLTDQSF
jgi:alpha-tubulin suppressor-like RCC1 family protein